MSFMQLYRTNRQLIWSVLGLDVKAIQPSNRQVKLRQSHDDKLVVCQKLRSGAQATLFALSLLFTLFVSAPLLAAEPEELRKSLEAARSTIQKLQSELFKLKKDRAGRQEPLVLNQRNSPGQSTDNSSRTTLDNKAALADLQKKLQLAVAKSAALAAEREKHNSLVSGHKAALTAARLESERLKAKLASLAKTELARQAAAQELRKARQALKTSAVETNKLRDNLQQANERAVALETRLANTEKLTVETGKVRVALQQARARIASLTKSLESSKAETTAAKNELQTAVSKLDSSATNMASAGPEITKLKADLAAARRESEQLGGKLADLTEVEMARKTAVQEADNFRVAKQQQDEELRKAKQAIQASATETKRLRDQLQVVGDGTAALEAKLDKVGALASKAEGFRVALREAEARIESLTKSVESSNAETAAANSKLEAALSKLDVSAGLKEGAFSEISELKDKLKTARRRSEQLESKLASLAETELARKAAVQEIDKLQAAKQQQDEELSKVKQAVQASTAETKRLRDQLQVLGDGTAALEAKLNKAGALASKAEGFRVALRKAEARIASLTKSVESSNAETAAANSKLEAALSKLDVSAGLKAGALSEISELKDKLKTARRRSEQLESKLASLAETELARKAAVQEIDKLQAAKKQQDEELRKADKTAQALTTEANVLREGVKEAKLKIATLDAELNKAKASAAKADGMSIDLKKAQARIDTLSEVANGFKAQNAAAKKELQAAISKLDALVADRDSALSEFAKLKVTLSAVRRDAEQQEAKHSNLLKSSEQARKTAIEEIAAANSTKKEIEKQLRNAQNELTRAADQLRNANQKVEVSKAEVIVLREKLAARKKQLLETKSTLTAALTEVRQTRDDISQRIERMIEVAIAPPSVELDELRSKLAAANEEIARLSAALRKDNAELGKEQTAAEGI